MFLLHRGKVLLIFVLTYDIIVLKHSEAIFMDIIKLKGATKDYLWGGNRLREKYGKQSEGEVIAESWELSFHPDGETKLDGGKTLREFLNPAMLGENLSAFIAFPTLIKFIDAKNDLSVQVHPSDEYALKNESSFGKTEMWYIVEAEDGAGIYLGFKERVTEEELRCAIEEKRLTDLLNFYPVSAGECYFIPSGTIHAIGRGCLICEIQQNSNLTYRVYDYGRRDKNGNERELHIEKALRVADLSAYEPKKYTGDLLGASKYFTVRKLSVNGEASACADTGSFKCLCAVRGAGYLEGKEIKAGDSFFIPAGYGNFKIKGDIEIIMTEIRKYYLGIDLGGTFIKGGIVDDLGNILVDGKVPTESDGGSEVVARNIASLCGSLLEKLHLTASDVVGIGMGVPGMIDSERGEVVYSNNLGWEHFMIGERVGELTGLTVKIANDANVAALGEAKFGCGKSYTDTVLITLGTGVGGGIVLGGRLFEGNKSAGAELGHSVIMAGGEPCSCGRRGCLEAYASATALIRETKRAMEKNPESKMWQCGGLDKVDGKVAFDYLETDEVARAGVKTYTDMLGVGLVNIANVFRPEAIMLGGGVCAEGERLTKPLQDYMDREIYAGSKGPAVKILIAELGNKAGILGAAALLM